MQNNLPTAKYKTNKTKNSQWDEWREDYVFIPLSIYAYVIKMRPAWRKGETPESRPLYALTEFLGRTPTENELQQVTRTPLMTHSPIYFALSVFAMNKGIPFTTLEKYYFRNKAWKDARAQLRKELRLGERENYRLTSDNYERYVQYFSRLTACLRDSDIPYKGID